MYVVWPRMSRIFHLISIHISHCSIKLLKKKFRSLPFPFACFISHCVPHAVSFSHSHCYHIHFPLPVSFPTVFLMLSNGRSLSHQPRVTQVVSPKDYLYVYCAYLDATQSCVDIYKPYRVTAPFLCLSLYLSLILTVGITTTWARFRGPVCGARVPAVVQGALLRAQLH